MMFDTEAQLAAVVVESLLADHWEVYQEVQQNWGQPVADIVATRGPVTWVIETKLSLSLVVMEQADKWKPFANMVSVAVPTRHRDIKGRTFAMNVLRQRGIGVLVVNTHIQHEARPEFRRRLLDPIRNYLREEHKSWSQAGVNGGGYYTPFADTSRKVVNYISQHPGCTLSDILGSVETHYHSDASARSALSQWIRTGVIKGVRCEREGRSLVLYPEEVAACK